MSISISTVSPEFANSSSLRESIVRRLRGQTVRIPDLRPVFVDWQKTYEQSSSQHVSQLRNVVNLRLQSLLMEHERLESLQAADFAHFTSLWWPKAPFDRLCVLAFLVIWLFTWDDEIDDPCGSCAANFQEAQVYRKNTLDFVEFSLGLNPGKEIPPGRGNYIIQSFDVIGSALCSSYTVEQRQRFYHEIERFVAASEREQVVKLSGDVPTLEDYWQFRLGTSAVYIGLAAAEYSIASRLPARAVMDCPLMKTIWDETNVMISITNDLLSLRKELKQGCIDSLVPLALASGRSMQQAITDAVSDLEASKMRFERAAIELAKQVHLMESEKMEQEISEFFGVCRSNCVGNLIWSLVTTRYSMQGLTDADGNQVFTIE